MTQTRLRIVENENPDYPTKEQIELYYFDVYEARQLLGRPDEEAILKHLRSGKVFAVKQGKKWMIRPDQISVLRVLIPHCRTDNVTNKHDNKVRSIFEKVRGWCTSTFRH